MRPFGDHAAPGDPVGVAQAEEGERGLGQDRAGDDHRRQRQHRRQRVGQDLAERDLERAHADDARAGDIVAFADRQHLGAGDAGRAGPGATARWPTTTTPSEGPTTLTKASASRKPGTVWNASVMRISASSTRPPTKPASVPTMVPTAIDGRGRGERDRERGARAVDDAGQHVAAEPVGAERQRPVLKRRQQRPGRRSPAGRAGTGQGRASANSREDSQDDSAPATPSGVRRKRRQCSCRASPLPMRGSSKA